MLLFSFNAVCVVLARWSRLCCGTGIQRSSTVSAKLTKASVWQAFNSTIAESFASRSKLGGSVYYNNIVIPNTNSFIPKTIGSRFMKIQDLIFSMFSLMSAIFQDGKFTCVIFRQATIKISILLLCNVFPNSYWNGKKYC